MIRLLIENNEVELNNEVQFAITKEFEDLTNPTDIINDWSKTVSIPFTLKNNQLFGHIYNEDKVIVSTDNTNLLPSSTIFNIIWNGSGYQTTTLQNGRIVYNGDVEYLQVCFLSQQYDYEKTLTFNCSSDTHSIDFIYNGETDYYLCFELINTNSSATSRNRVRYIVWQLYNNGLEVGKTYTLHFQHKISNGSYVIYNFSVKEKEVLTGIYFNPLLKLPFRLEWNNAILMTGYAKMNDVTSVNGNGTYNLTLYGQLGKVFYEMKKITFDSTTDDDTYLIDGSLYVNNFINNNLVYNSWVSSGLTHSNLLKTTDDGYVVTDIIGFAPNNSFNEDFKYDNFQYSDASSRTFVEELEESNFIGYTGVAPDTVIPNGLLPREIGEYRSYMQLPYIYWNKLFQVFQEKAEEITGYTFDLDNEWFNLYNPYWYNLVYMLKSFDSKNEDVRENKYKPYINTYYWTADTSDYTTEKSNEFTFTGTDYETISIYDPSTNTFELGNYTVLIDSVYTVLLYIHQSSWEINPDNALIYSFKITDENDNVLETIESIVCNEDYTGSTSGYYNVSKLGRCSYTEQLYLHLTLPLNIGKYGVSKVKIWTSIHWLNSNAMVTVGGDPYYPITGRSFKAEIYGCMYNDPMTFKVIYNRHRTNSLFTLNDLWNNDYNLFDEIIKYCKIYRIGIFVDDINKKIIFKLFNKFFRDYSVSDWTNKIDKSKDFTIVPVSFDNKYVLFNYADNKTSLNEDYVSKYGVNYGEYRLVTDYNFNNNTTNLFDKVKNGIVNTDNVLSWTNLYDNHNIVYSLPSEIYVYSKDKDNKFIDTFGQFYFHRGTAVFCDEAELHMRPVKISDDTLLLIKNNTYFYTQTAANTISVLTYPLLDVVYDDFVCLYNVPKENYTYQNNYNGKKSIYTNFWLNYLNERYNIQNKKITCYVDLNPIEYGQFDFNKLVKVNNQLCMVNKIYDYDITSNGTTKVDLITIQDVSAYIDDTYLSEIDLLGLSWDGSTYYSGDTNESPAILGTVSSISDVTFEDGTTSYTSNGVTFTIVDSSIYYQKVEAYVDKDDIDFTVTLKNAHDTTSFDCQRYSVYPYPWIIITDSNETEVSTLSTGSQTYKLRWHGTETEGLENKPTVNLRIVKASITGDDTFSLGSDWVEDTVMILEGDDEWFRTEYNVTLNTDLNTGSTLVVTMTDNQGWHETRTYTVS